jgi:hypothetical protein
MIYSGDDAPAKRPTGVSVRQAMWSWAVPLALVLGLGAIFYGINARHNAQTAAKEPAILAAPAPAAGVPAPTPQTSTGQPVPETTGQGRNDAR